MSFTPQFTLLERWRRRNVMQWWGRVQKGEATPSQQQPRRSLAHFPCSGIFFNPHHRISIFFHSSQPQALSCATFESQVINHHPPTCLLHCLKYGSPLDDIDTWPVAPWYHATVDSHQSLVSPLVNYSSLAYRPSHPGFRTNIIPS